MLLTTIIAIEHQAGGSPKATKFGVRLVKGDAIVYGKSVQREMHQIRQILGVAGLNGDPTSWLYLEGVFLSRPFDVQSFL